MKLLDALANASIIVACISLISVLAVAVHTTRANRKLEESKRVAQLATDAFVDLWKALYEIAECSLLIGDTDGHLTAEQLRELMQRRQKAQTQWHAAKTRLAIYGNHEISKHLAQFGRDGGFNDGRSDHVQGLARILVEVRADLGLPRDLNLSDLEHVLVTRWRPPTDT